MIWDDATRGWKIQCFLVTSMRRAITLECPVWKEHVSQLYHTISMYGQLGGPRMGRALTAMKKKVES